MPAVICTAELQAALEGQSPVVAVLEANWSRNGAQPYAWCRECRWYATDRPGYDYRVHDVWYPVNLFMVIDGDVPMCPLCGNEAMRITYCSGCDSPACRNDACY